MLVFCYICINKPIDDTTMTIKHLLLCGLLLTPIMGCAQQTETSNEVIKTIMERRSVRRYLDRPVEHEKLALLAKCGINAPSGMNSQPWAVRVVENKTWVDGLTAIYRKLNPEAVKRDAHFKTLFRNAPNVIVIATPKDGSGKIEAGLLGENILLAAQSLGLGTCCLGGPLRFMKATPEAQPYIQQLNIPADYDIDYLIAVGYPDEQPDAKPRIESKIQFIK